jgi:ribonuclease D
VTASTQAGRGEEVSLIESQQAFDQLLERFRGEPLLAVDTEAASFHRYHDRVYLIQVSSRETTAVIDPLKVRDLGALGELLADPEVEVVLHDADYDLRILDRDYQFRARRVFDTRIAAQLLNEPGIGLAALLEKFFGVRLDKKHQRADWSRRPLTAGMLAYAAADTRHLPALRDRLQQELQAAGRWPWASEEFALLEGVRWSPPGPADEAYLRLKGARRLKGRPLAVLRELYAWREDTARELDKALFRVVTNEALLALAEAAPTSKAALQEVRGLSAEVVGRRGDQVLAAIQRGLQSPPGRGPVVERERRAPRDPEAEARLERIKAARNRRAIELNLAPGVLCPNAVLEAIARSRPSTVRELAAVPGMKQWQAAVLGEELIRILGASA